MPFHIILAAIPCTRAMMLTVLMCVSREIIIKYFLVFFFFLFTTWIKSSLNSMLCTSLERQQEPRSLPTFRLLFSLTEVLLLTFLVLVVKPLIFSSSRHNLTLHFTLRRMENFFLPCNSVRSFSYSLWVICDCASSSLSLSSLHLSTPHTFAATLCNYLS